MPLGEKHIAAIRKLVAEHGEKKTGVLLEVASATLSRALAGLPLARATVTHLQTRLAEQKEKKASKAG